MTRNNAQRSKWARVRRAWELGCVGMIAVMGILLFLALLPWLPDMVGGTLKGDAEAARGLFSYVAGVGICWLVWHWREAICPQLRKDAQQRREVGSQPSRRR